MLQGNAETSAETFMVGLDPMSTVVLLTILMVMRTVLHSDRKPVGDALHCDAAKEVFGQALSILDTGELRQIAMPLIDAVGDHAVAWLKEFHPDVAAQIVHAQITALPCEGNVAAPVVVEGMLDRFVNKDLN